MVYVQLSSHYDHNVHVRASNMGTGSPRPCEETTKTTNHALFVPFSDAVMAKVMASVEQLGRPYAAFYTAGGSDLHVGIH